MRQRSLKFIALVTCSVLLTVSFQNCGKAGFDGATQNSLSLQSGVYDPVPFAFDATFDQISYNSCFGPQLAGKKGYYTLAAGAYQTGGVWLRKDFLDYINSGAIKPEYPATTITNLQVKNALASSATNTESAPQIAIRTRGNPQQIRTPAAAAATEGIDYHTMLGDLTDDRWMEPLVSQPEARSIYFNLAPGGQRNLHAEITYNKDEGAAEGLRSDLRTSGSLALTYKIKADQGTGSMARPVGVSSGAPDMMKVHGRGYNLNFESVLAPYTNFYGTGFPNSMNPSNILTAIQEVDLSGTGNATAQWTCSEARRYMVVRKSDQNQFCPRDQFSYTLSGIPNLGISAEQYRRELEVVRRHLKAEDWDVSIQYRCVVPRHAECYVADAPINGQIPGIEYDQRQPCYQGLADVSYPGAPPIKRCAQYVSICTRN